MSRTSQSPSAEKVPEESLHGGTCDGGQAGKQQMRQKDNVAVAAIPVVDKEKITFCEKIWHSSFGVAFKGSLAGTDVAI